ncbi:MAG TPA: hypothetical protein VIX84_21185, partial [Acidimicrobiales bacterium]
GPSDAGCVVLDIGPGAGAAVVVTPSSLCGEEIEVRRAGNAWNGTHVAVRARHGGEVTQYAAIFGGLPQGHYEFRVRGGDEGAAVLVVQVDEAGVALAHWPETRGHRR